MQKFNLVTLHDEAALRKRISELGLQISADYSAEKLVVVGILKGAFIFLGDLVRAISLPMQIEFMGVASYAGTESTGHVRITNDLSADIKGSHVLLVEDIVDTGHTIDFLMDTLRVREPASLKICTLLSKPEVHKMRHPLAYVGFEITREFVVGYGLDVDGYYRNLPYIAQVSSSE